MAFARIENHYFVNGGLFEVDGQMLRDVDRVRHIPAVISQGRCDMVRPIKTAWELFGPRWCRGVVVAFRGRRGAAAT